MLPGIRILFALVVLSFAILIFGFGALALLRTAHQSLASQPTWQQDWRTPVEIANARRDEPAAGETQTLALLRVETPIAKPDTQPAQPQTQDAQDKAAPVDATADVGVPPPAVPPSPSLADTSGNDKPATAPAETAPSEKTADQATSPGPPNADPAKVADSSEQLKVAVLPNASNDEAAPSATEPDTSSAPAKASAGEPPYADSEAEPSAPKSEPPVKLAALPDAVKASTEPARQARQQSVRQSNAAELRSKRRARARLHARRLAQARARAARLAQTQQTTNSSFYNSNFTTTGSGATSTTPNATPFGAPRTAAP